MADVPNAIYEDVAKTVDLNEVVVKGKASSGGGFFSKIGDFVSGLFKKQPSTGTTIPKTPTVKTPTTTTNTSTPKTSIGMDPVSAIANAVGTITDSVFGFLGQKQTTKQKEIEIQGLEKQKEIVEAQGDIETTKLLAAKIEVQKQELVNAQKKETGANIVKLGIILGVFALAGFVVYQIFKTPKAPKVVAAPAVVPNPQPLK